MSVWFVDKQQISEEMKRYSFGIFMFETPQSVNIMLKNISDIHHYQTRGSLQDNYFRIPVNKKITKTAISYSGPKFWNDIPASIRDSHSFEKFKKKSRELLLSQDKDIFCF